MSRLFLRICAVLIVFRAFTNFVKLFQGDGATLVFFGRILHGGTVAVPAVVVGLFMLAAGVALWNAGKWALPLVGVYAAYVTVNLLSWLLINPEQLELVGRRVSSASDPNVLYRNGALAFAGYCIVALATTAGPAWILWKQRART
jgi:hypothetical protein